MDEDLKDKKKAKVASVLGEARKYLTRFVDEVGMMPSQLATNIKSTSEIQVHAPPKMSTVLQNYIYD